MREYIYIIVFTIGLIWTVYQRYRFETMTNKVKIRIIASYTEKTIILI